MVLRIRPIIIISKGDRVHKALSVTKGYCLACQITYLQNPTISVTIGLRIAINYIIRMLHTLK